MVQVIQRYAVLFGSLLLVALIAFPMSWAIQSNRGVPGPTLLEAVNPATGTIVLLLGAIVMAVIAIGVGRQLNVVVGLFVLGCGIGVLAMRSGNVADYAWANGSLWALGFETIIWGLALAAIVAAVFRFAGGLPDLPEDWNRPPTASFAALTEPASRIQAATGLLALPVVWVILGDDLKGQAIAAVAVGSLVAAIVARMARPNIEPILIFAAPVLAGGLAQLVIASGWSTPPAEALVLGTLPRLTYVMPMDWVAGSLVGVSLGLGLARSFIQEDNG